MIFGRGVKDTSEFTFNKAIDEMIKVAGSESVTWFEDVGEAERWSKYLLNPKVCSDENTCKFVETFITTLGLHKCHPVISVLDFITTLGLHHHTWRSEAGSRKKG